jgi:ribonuclease P protein component
VKRQFRLTRSTDFKRVRRIGKSYAHPLVVLIAAPGEAARLRIGVTAGRSVGKAVRRNRGKRLLRTAIAAFIPELPPGWDLVLIARPALLQTPFQQIRQAIAELLGRARLQPPHGS